jgi:integrase/recombinase XerD
MSAHAACVTRSAAGGSRRARSNVSAWRLPPPSTSHLSSPLRPSLTCRATAAPPATTPSPTCGSSSTGVRIASSRRWPLSATTSSCTCAWLQDVRRYKPSTVSRRLSVVASFYRTCVIDGVLEHSPADYVRRPSVPPESPTLGLTHLQFEAMLTAARESTNPFDFALVCLLGLLGLRIFETVGADIDDLGEEHGHRVLRVRGKGGKIVLVPLPPAVSRAVDRAAGERPTGPLLLNRRGSRMDRHAATRRLRQLAAVAGVRLPRMHPHMLRHTFVTTMLDAGVDLRDVQIAARHADPRTTMRYDRARKNLDRHPNYILAAYMASGT